MEGARRKGLLGGLAGVWLSSTLYGAIVMARSPLAPRIPLALALAFAVAVFPLSFLAWRDTGRRLVYTLAGSALALILAVAGLPCSLLPALGSAAFLLVGLLGGGELLIVFGGAAVGSIGGLLACISAQSPLLGVLPLAYHVVSIGKATVRVTGNRAYTPLWLGVWASLLGASLLLGPGAAAVIALDGASRLLEQATGLDARLSPKKYGIIETIRIMLALPLLALAATPGGA